jgi:hypothetical protein
LKFRHCDIFQQYFFHQFLVIKTLDPDSLEMLDPDNTAIRYNKLDARQVKKKFYDAISRKENKTICSGLRITRMALSNQSEIPAFISPWKVNLKISHRLPRLAKSRKIIYRE